MIRYPSLEAEAVIGVTAPSSGVGEELRELLELACSRLQEQGYGVVCGATAWTQDKAKSAPASVRAAEFNAMMADDSIGLHHPALGRGAADRDSGAGRFRSHEGQMDSRLL